MKRKQTLAILVVTTLWLLGTSCKKEPEVIQVDAGFEQAYSFKVGSYWTYKDSLTGDVDSFVVTSKTTNVGPVDFSNDHYEVIETTIKSFPIGAHADDAMSISLGLMGTNLLQNYKTQDRVNAYSFQTTIYPFSSVTANSAVLKLQNFDVNGTSYSNVIGCLVGRTGINDDWFYYRESIGIVKIRISTNGILKRVWELQDSHIVH